MSKEQSNQQKSKSDLIQPEQLKEELNKEDLEGISGGVSGEVAVDLARPRGTYTP